MKRIEFTITGEDGRRLQEPGFVEQCSELPIAIMRAVEDYLEANDGALELPIRVDVRPSAAGPTC